MTSVLTVYTRYGCHLCDEMLGQLDGLRDKYQFQLEIIDISHDARLESLYGTRVPVLASPEEDICYYFLDEEALDSYFRAS